MFNSVSAVCVYDGIYALPRRGCTGTGTQTTQSQSPMYYADFLFWLHLQPNDYRRIKVRSHELRSRLPPLYRKWKNGKCVLSFLFTFFSLLFILVVVVVVAVLLQPALCPRNELQFLYYYFFLVFVRTSTLRHRLDRFSHSVPTVRDVPEPGECGLRIEQPLWKIYYCTFSFFFFVFFRVGKYGFSTDAPLSRCFRCLNVWLLKLINYFGGILRHFYPHCWGDLRTCFPHSWGLHRCVHICFLFFFGERLRVGQVLASAPESDRLERK